VPVDLRRYWAVSPRDLEVIAPELDRHANSEAVKGTMSALKGSILYTVLKKIFNLKLRWKINRLTNEYERSYDHFLKNLISFFDNPLGSNFDEL
jgi:hypothetical protein